MKRITCLMTATALCGVLMAVSATSAVAQNPSLDGYDEASLSTIPPLDVALSRPGPVPKLRPLSPSGPPGTDKPVSVDDADLPFTGLSVPLLALIGGALVAAGALTRRQLSSQVR